jgi:hypothetical protein
MSKQLTGVCEFTATCGPNGNATAPPPGLKPGQQVAMNGSTDLCGCMQGNDGACVYSITLEPGAGVYAYVLLVDAQGPKGIGSGSLNLVFVDMTGDHYNLAITSSTRETHTLRYNSSNPDIVEIAW